ncbi:hypothetical protein [Natronorubrum halophilum]|uniref:hypothetical protein n=1 Tax=Natronorubrum halophilum TaxID=1702106 RepID=UPI000EF72EEF|nr:hypothetical protein [Natronorubrum halophilum]
MNLIPDKPMTDVVLENIQSIQVVILFGLLSTISYALGWGHSNREQIKNQDITQSVFAEMTSAAQPALVPSWVEPTIVILGILFFATVVLEAYAELRLESVDI